MPRNSKNATAMSLEIQHDFMIPKDIEPQRLDQAVAYLLPQYSRSRLQQWIRAGGLTVNGAKVKPRDRVLGGEKVSVSVTEEGGDDEAEDIPLDVVYEDDALLVINKPPGLVVHPGAGNPRGTLLNALLHHASVVASVPRAGIVHRLDKETSGLLVVAKSLEAQNYLVREIQARTVTRVYHAVVYGAPSSAQGRVEGAIGRHPTQRKKMAIRSDGKEAVTHYRVIGNYSDHSLVECRLETGRTHQIRIHLQSMGLPLVGDPVYGGHYRRPGSGDENLADALKGFHRQALHACRLGLKHPVTGREMQWRADYPDDFQDLIWAIEDAEVE